jgi:uncharacterized protein with HEPN domain
MADRERLGHILEAIARARAVAARGRAAVMADEIMQAALQHHLVIVGEAVSRLSPELRAEHPEVPWARIVAVRNRLVHAYFAVDLEVVWGIAADDLPRLDDGIRALLAGQDTE